MNKNKKLIFIIVVICILVLTTILIFFFSKSKIESLVSIISSNNYQFSKENCSEQTLRYGKKKISFYIPNRFLEIMPIESTTYSIICRDPEHPLSVMFSISFAEQQGIYYAPNEATEFKYNSNTYKYISVTDFDKNADSNLYKDTYFIYCYLEDGTLIIIDMEIKDNLSPDEFAAFLTIESK